MSEDRNAGEVQLPVDVSELGDVLYCELECPGVYYISVKPPDSHRLLAEEYYIILENSYISKDARQYGIPLLSGHGLFISISQGDAGSKVILYEILRYKYLHGLPLPETDSLLSCAMYGAEFHPTYFGMLPVPQATPWGVTTRNRTLANGIYWLETDQCVETLAVSYPIWKGEFSEAALRYTYQTDFDKQHGIDNTFGYQFFPRKAICVAVFELLGTRSEWVAAKKVDLPALQNAIWNDCPEYAVAYNAGEMCGLHDSLGLLLSALGCEAELSVSEERVISLNPRAGTAFWRW